ncbi:MAG: endo-alpha-N-acetylgalactosaminidase family protein [Clostridiaceae bacterium]|nr:endo-alpha-N-acetylgalactosaminidase family protein [Clostridiaceae bacterium]
MNRKTYWKGLVLGAAAMVLSCGTPGMASRAADTVTLTGDKMNVEMDMGFPRVIEYKWNDGDKVFYGQPRELTKVRINGIDYEPAVTGRPDQSGKTMEYELDFSGTELDGVTITMAFTLDGSVLTMEATEISDPQEKVRYLEFPDQGLLSVRGDQAGGEVVYNDNFVNGDHFYKASEKPADASRKKVGHVFFNTEELAATLESDMTCQYNYLQTRDLDGVKETSVSNIDFMYRGPDGSVTNLPWCKITITDDCNGDGVVNWQDGAVAYRKIMDPMIGENLGRQTIAVNILLNYWGRLPWTWENGLDYVKRQALATDSFPQIMLVKGSHRQYGDGWPSYGDTNPMLGGNDQFRWLIEEAAKYNITVGSHTNSVEAYPESPFYEETPKYNGGVWDFVDRGGTAVDDIEYWESGLLDSRYEAHKNEFPDMKFQYLDVSAARWDRKEDRWTTYKTLQKFKEMDWTYFTEMYKGYVEYTLNDTTTAALSPKYVTWCHTYYYGEENGGGNHGNSDIRRFIINDQAIYEAGTDYSQEVLGPGYQKTYGFLGWSESQKTVDGMVAEFWQHTLADTYLKNFPLLSIREAADGVGRTAEFEGGVKSEFDGSKRTISRNGIVFAELNDSRQDIFMPWDPEQEEKIYTYRSTGGSRQWELPDSWKGLSSLWMYRMDETNGKVLVKEVPVTEGRVTIEYEAGCGYVLYREAVSEKEVVWGDGLPVKDGNFNSSSFRYWVPENSSQAEIRKDDGSGNYYLAVAGESRVTQHITGLEQGRGYVVSAMVKTSGKRPGMLEIDCGGVKKSQYSADYDTKTVMGNAFDNWSQIRVYFTADSGEADVSLAGLSGSGAVYFDDIRIYEEEDPNGAEGHEYFENFETSHSMGPFVHENGEMARLAYSNNGVNEAVTLV